ncbi:MAG: pyridoxamine 5'-phosphate oxidase family protein [Candidatus Promineifilaceae bacterium]
MEKEFNEIIADEKTLREIIGYPSDMNANKVIPILDDHCKAFIARSPYLLLASSDGDGNLDISPKGDPPGFVQILDNQTIAIPDRIGNGRIDTLTNIVENDQVALFFLIPGKRETLRVSGSAIIVRDNWLREQMAVKGKLPNLAIVVKVQRAFMHCAKSMIRSKIWQPDLWQDSSDMSSLSRILIDHANLSCSVDELQEFIDESYEKRLY